MKKFILLSILFAFLVNSSKASIFDWFRSSLSNTEHYIGEITKKIKNITIEYDTAFEYINKKDKKALKHEIVKSEYSLPYTKYIQKVDVLSSDLYYTKNQIKKYIQKSSPTSQADLNKYDNCIKRYKNLKNKMLDVTKKLENLKNFITTTFSKILIKELIELKTMYDRIPRTCSCDCSSYDYYYPCTHNTYNYNQTNNENDNEKTSTQSTTNEASQETQSSYQDSIISGPEDVVMHMYNT